MAGNSSEGNDARASDPEQRNPTGCRAVDKMQESSTKTTESHTTSTNNNDEAPSPIKDSSMGSDLEKGRQQRQQSDEADGGKTTTTPTDDEDNKKKQSAFKALGWLDRFLAVWVFLAMAVGIILGNFVPEISEALDKGQFVGVSVPIAIGLLVMMYPILCNVRFEVLHLVFRDRGIWRQIAFSIVMNWIVAPFLMLALAWACLPDEPQLRTGVILVGLGRCIAMVLIWVGLSGGDSEYCAILVAINSLLQMVLFAPMAVFFIRVISGDDSLQLSYDVVARSVGVFLGIPFGAAIVSRLGLRELAGLRAWYDRVFMRWVQPWSLIGLLYTILILFAYQGHQVVHQIVSVCRVAVPMILYFFIIFFVTLYIAYRAGLGYRMATTQSFTAASNNFELAIAVAVATYGPHSDQALAGTVGPLTEVPVLLGLVYVVKWAGKRWGWEG